MGEVKHKTILKSSTKIAILLWFQAISCGFFLILNLYDIIRIDSNSVVFVAFVLILPSIIIYGLFNKEIASPIKLISIAASKLSGNEDLKIEVKVENELSELVENLRNINQKITKATSFAQYIGDGKFDVILDETTKDFGLGKALDEMRSKLKNVADDERKRNWNVEGLAKFGQLFREHQNDDLQEFAYLILLNLIKYINANQGAVYMLNESEGNETSFIEMIACYAYERRKFKTVTLEIGEGLVGQCMIDKESIYINEVPEDYMKITSGLGEGSPRAVLLTPLKAHDQVFGAIEMASFEEIEPYQIDFVNEIAESFASTLSSVRTNQHTQKLLFESQKIASELRIKENELVSNEEELRSAQETLNNKLIELQAETNLTKCILDAINKSNAAIEFDMDGNILNANEMFLSVMGYEKSEIIGMQEEDMVPEDEIISKRYSMLWDSLKKGNFNTGEFKRFSKSGKEVWLDATYNPILDLRGEPYKILMFANFTTEAKEKENDYKNRINALNDTFGFVELNLDLSLKSANQIFLDQFKLKRKDVRNLSLEKLIDPEINGPDKINTIKTKLTEGQSLRQNILVKIEEGYIEEFSLAIYLSKSITGKLVSYFAILVPLHQM